MKVFLQTNWINFIVWRWQKELIELIEKNNAVDKQKTLKISCYIEQQKIIVDKNMKEEQTKNQQELHPLSLQRMQNVFILNGITALLTWNALLGAFDYFNSIYKQYNVSLYFPIPIFLGYTTTGILFNLITFRFPYKILIPFGITLSNITMLLFLVISILCKNMTELGFWCCMVTGFFLGFFSNIVQLSFYGMINYFGQKTVSRFTVGTAVSGLSIMIVRAIITAGFGSQHPQEIMPIIIYLTLAMLFNFFDMYLNLKMFKTKQYEQKIEKPFEQQRKLSQIQCTPENIETTNNEMSELKKPYIKLLWQSLKHTVPYPLYIFFNFVISFILFPNLTFCAKTSLKSTWSIITFLIVYNMGDFSGKFLGDFRGSFNATSVRFLFFSRLFFFYTIPLMTKNFTQSDYLLNNNFFPFINQYLFAFTNGLVVNSSFILSYEVAPKQYKKYAGVLAGILLQFGITVGTFLAMPFVSFVNPDT